MTTTHPYPALPLTNKQRHPEHYAEQSWDDLLIRGCPRCGCFDFTMWSPCHGLHDIEIVVDFDAELEEDFVCHVWAYWRTHTDGYDGAIHCYSCHLEINVDQTVIDYA